MSNTILFKVSKEKRIRATKCFQNAWLYGPSINETLWPKYGKTYSLFADLFGENDWDGLEKEVLSSDNFDDKMVYLSMACGFFHTKDKEKVGNAIIRFAENNELKTNAIKERMIEVGNAIKELDDDSELFGLCLNGIDNYVAAAFNTSYETFLAHAKEEFPNESEEFYDNYYEKMALEYRGRKMYEDDIDYSPLQVVHISDNNSVIVEDLSEFYNRQKNLTVNK